MRQSKPQGGRNAAGRYAGAAYRQRVGRQVRQGSGGGANGGMGPSGWFAARHMVEAAVPATRQRGEGGRRWVWQETVQGSVYKNREGVKAFSFEGSV